MALFKRKSRNEKSVQDGSALGRKSAEKSFDELSAMVDGKAGSKEKRVKSKDKKTSGKGKEELKHDHGEAYKYIVRPVITEKVSFMGMYNSYVFEVSPKANKVEIKKAIKKLYGVEPVKINVMNMSGKKVRYGRQFGKLKNWKKAIVTLKSGDKIDVYEGV